MSVLNGYRSEDGVLRRFVRAHRTYDIQFNDGGVAVQVIGSELRRHGASGADGHNW